MTLSKIVLKDISCMVILSLTDLRKTFTMRKCTCPFDKATGSNLVIHSLFTAGSSENGAGCTAKAMMQN